MIELYLDCEWNSNEGTFISLALYNPKGESFYEVDKNVYGLFPSNIRGDCLLDPWVRDNVLPKLLKTPIYWHEINAKLATYLNSFEDEITIYADWPLDFYHLMPRLVINGAVPSKLISSLTMKLITTPDDHVSAIPHNALEDARALYQNHKFTVITNLR